MLKVGLTGGIGSGKSTVSARLAELGAVVLDADKAARAVVEPGTPGLAAITADFGPGVLTADGSLDRAKLAGIVFADEAALARLNAITHPLIHEYIRAAEEEAVRAGGDGVVLVHDVALLAEWGRAKEFDLVIVVDVPAETQLERLTGQRGMAEDQARARMAAQASRRPAAGGGRHRHRQFRFPRGPGPAGVRGLGRAAGPRSGLGRQRVRRQRVRRQGLRRQGLRRQGLSWAVLGCGVK